MKEKLTKVDKKERIGKFSTIISKIDFFFLAFVSIWQSNSNQMTHKLFECEKKSFLLLWNCEGEQPARK